MQLNSLEWGLRGRGALQQCRGCSKFHEFSMKSRELHIERYARIVTNAIDEHSGHCVGSLSRFTNSIQQLWARFKNTFSSHFRLFFKHSGCSDFMLSCLDAPETNVAGRGQGANRANRLGSDSVVSIEPWLFKASFVADPLCELSTACRTPAVTR